MLLRLDAMVLRGCFAEMKELANLPPELRQVAILFPGKILHKYIVSRYYLWTQLWTHPSLRGQTRTIHLLQI